jgi:predicted peptidase
MFEVKFFKNLQYLIHYPNGYDVNKKYPLIIFFHGSGSRGTDAYALRKNDFFLITEQYEDMEFITVAPVCHEDTWFDLWETLRAFTEEITLEKFCDAERVYAVGHSMGGYAVWQMGMSMPQYFAAIVPICGGGMYWNAGRLKNIPIWAFHGEKDNVVKAEESIKMVDAVNAAGGKARLTLYPEVNHMSWCDAYADRALFEWLFAQSKNFKKG